MEKEKLKNYIELISSFVNDKIPVQEFERNYLDMVINEEYIFGDEIFKIIQTLFSDVDSYCGDPEIANYDPDDPFADIDEAELKKRAKHALELLTNLK